MTMMFEWGKANVATAFDYYNEFISKVVDKKDKKRGRLKKF
jgi:hypothetical protein